jgi:hypothetical protein
MLLIRLNRHGGLTLDVLAEKLTMAVINKYLALRARTMLRSFHEWMDHLVTAQGDKNWE